MIHLDVLRRLSLRGHDGVELHAVLAQPKRLAVLVFLALARPDGFARRDTLLAYFWPEFSPERARQALRQSLYHLRRHLGTDAISNRGTAEVGINPACIRCDAVTFRTALEAGRLSEALSVYGGDVLPGFVVADAAPALERWLEDERADLRAAAAEAAGRLASPAAIPAPLAPPRRRWRAVAALLLHYVLGAP